MGEIRNLQNFDQKIKNKVTFWMTKFWMGG
jgi:hypothetical protein